MRQVIFNYYVIELGTYSLIAQRVLYGVIMRQGYIADILPHNSQQKHAFWG